LTDNVTKKGYLKRPLPLLIINAGYLVTPLFYAAILVVFYFTARSGSSTVGTNYFLLTENILVLIVATSITGVCLYWMNKFSWIMVIIHSTLIIIHNIFILSINIKMSTTNLQEILVIAIFQVVTVGIIAYFILIRKQFREIFFNQRLRWWESKTRYKLDSPLELLLDDGTSIPVQLQDISSGGVCAMKSGDSINLEKLQSIKCSHENLQFSSPVRIIWESNDRFGLKFINIDKSQKKVLKKIIGLLHRREQKKEGR
jgi:hypothetical protein